MKMKKLLLLVYAVTLMTYVCDVPTYAANGDVAGAIEGTWDTASQQIRTVVNNVAFPATGLILAAFFFVKLRTAYSDYWKHGQFEQATPTILFACLVFMLTAPLYIWQILGIQRRKKIMRCWGIAVLGSDTGPNAVCYIRRSLPKDGKLELDAVIQRLQRDSWNRPADVLEGISHTGPMVLAEMMFQLIDHDLSRLDYPDEGMDKDKKFGILTSFQASKDALQWLRDYLSDTLQSAVENARQKGDWSGWFQKEGWERWRKHMTSLVERLDNLLVLSGDTMDLLTVQQPGDGQIMG